MDYKNLISVVKVLEQNNIKYALGGSGLLLSLGLTNEVNDWDITIENPKNELLNVLKSFDIKEIDSGDYPFASKYKFLVHNVNPKVEIIGYFSIKTSNGVCNLPTISVKEWKNIQIGSPEVWYVAYSLMDRIEKANKLFFYLKVHGANANIINLMLKEPLPDYLKIKLKELLNN
ncbi:MULTISPECIES: hypothetical protein [Bacillaceae]|uniref:Uncharacterized protein n=1 Tax=Gottfriedia luciferensis TaxID=178774 RepID=A0ABX2ZNR0_9BACI|nr:MULTISPECIES: hypothetical protein [Bacillaceae]ODG91243.1 hypothetical protein BED47_06155 [Gottfriedia luciferensis]PGZ91913.1 hypothetical protein COE53_11030 [Bacillus sp. AFS029533]SFD54050.1 hypothetical protein SAMN02799633_04071 [Bacillus sp. UNCCL81]